MGRIEREIENELLNLRQMNKINAELNHLQDSLNNCIDLVADSANGPAITNKLDELKTRNNEAFKDSTTELEERIELSKKNLYHLSTKKEEDEEEEEDHEDKEEEEVNEN